MSYLLIYTFFSVVACQMSECPVGDIHCPTHIGTTHVDMLMNRAFMEPEGVQRKGEL